MWILTTAFYLSSVKSHLKESRTPPPLHAGTVCQMCDEVDFFFCILSNLPHGILTQTGYIVQVDPYLCVQAGDSLLSNPSVKVQLVRTLILALAP